MGTSVRIMLLLGIVAVGALSTAVSSGGEVGAQTPPAGTNIAVIVINPRRPAVAPPSQPPSEVLSLTASGQAAGQAGGGTGSAALPSTASGARSGNTGLDLLAVVGAGAFVAVAGVSMRRVRRQ